MMKHKRGKKKEETPYKVNFPNLKDKTLQTETEWKFSSVVFRNGPMQQYRTATLPKLEDRCTGYH